VIALAMLATAALAASAPGPARVDRDHGVRFDLKGTVLTVSLVSPDAGEELWGKRIRAICSPVFGSQARFRAVRAVEVWPDGAPELSYSFDRDVSEAVKWCLLEDADGGGDVAGVDFQAFFRVDGDTPKDRKIGRQLRAYLWRNVGDAWWMRKVAGIVVERGVIAVSTELRPNRRGKRVARDICRLIQGSDVADFTAGHTVFGRDDVGLRVCRARER
jgi:hypothetical protein